MSSLLVRLLRPRHPRVGQAIIPDPEMLDYYFEEYQLGGVTRSLIRSDPPLKGVSQRLPLGTEGPKKQDGLVGPMDVWLVHDLLNDMMN
ncbi:MAG: hypothetical protein AB9860_07765 [Methanomassiliicoccales archaeon]